MSKADISAGQKVIIEVFRSNAARFVVEIDQNVAAEDNVELALWTGLLGLHDIDAREPDRLPEIVEDQPSLLIELTEVFRDQMRRQSHQGALAVYARFRCLEDPGVDVRTDDFDVERVDFRPVLEEPYRDGIRLLPRGARRRPYSDAAASRLGSDALAQQVVGQAFQLMVFSLEIGFVDRKRIDEMLDLIAEFAAKKCKVIGKGKV